MIEFHLFGKMPIPYLVYVVLSKQMVLHPKYSTVI